VDSEIDRSYLFRHKIEYQWQFELEPESRFAKVLRWRREPANISLQPRSLGPSVVQYFPRPGQTTVSVKLVYGNEAKELPAIPGRIIRPSTDFQPYKTLARAEFASWVIAAMVAIATGLTMFYFKGTSWGTFQDYLTLFLCGIGVDQGKNFLQALQTYSAQPGTPPTVPAPSHA
jgi:hypothetical protein